jgi:hypothetical protein
LLVAPLQKEATAIELVDGIIDLPMFVLVAEHDDAKTRRQGHAEQKAHE